MISPARLAANRANARRSTGPRTADGKRRSSMNALVHGVYAEMRLLTDEDRARHDAIRDAVLDAFEPVGRYEEGLAGRLAFLWWQLGRALEAETRLLARVRREGAENAFRASLREIRALDRVGRLEFKLQEAVEQVEQLLVRRQALRKRMGRGKIVAPAQAGAHRSAHSIEPPGIPPSTPPSGESVFGFHHGPPPARGRREGLAWLRSVKKISTPVFSMTYAQRFGAVLALPAMLAWLESAFRKPPLTLPPGIGTMRA